MLKQIGASLRVENKSVDFIGADERYGHPRRLFTIWFSVNLSIVCLTVGMIGVQAGLGLVWALVALLLGSAVGTIFMAAHSAQGPHLGIPQMIQSRAQFGVIGAAIPLISVVLTYTLYMSADAVIVRGILASLLGVGEPTAIICFGAITLVVAFVGYELIHRLGAALSVTSGVLFGVTAVLLYLDPGHRIAGNPTADVWHMDKLIFVSTLTQAAAWSLTFGPYVADYSRYLPIKSTTSETFWFTAIGNFLGTSITMSLGAVIAAYFPSIAEDPGLGVSSLFGRADIPIRFLIVFGVMQGNVLNLYSAYMSSVTVLTAFNMRQSRVMLAKLGIMIAVTAVASWIAVAARENFDSNFGDMLSVMGYLLVPWSAVNLADYYFVRAGRYNIQDLFHRNGIYAAFNPVGIGVYFVTVATEIPFAQLSQFSGVVAQYLGADISWVVGLLIPMIFYTLFERQRLSRHPSLLFTGIAE